MTKTAIVVFLSMLAIAFAAGWYGSALYQENQHLLIDKAAAASAEKTRSLIEAGSSATGRMLEDKLAELKANESHTQTLIRTEVIKPVFNNVCATDEYVRLFNDAVSSAERTLSGKSTDTVPEK